MGKAVKIDIEYKEILKKITISNPISKNTWILDVHGIGGDC